jgi:hypothetical protein
MKKLIDEINEVSFCEGCDSSMFNYFFFVMLCVLLFYFVLFLKIWAVLCSSRSFYSMVCVVRTCNVWVFFKRQNTVFSSFQGFVIIIY